MCVNHSHLFKIMQNLYKKIFHNQISSKSGPKKHKNNIIFWKLSFDTLKFYTNLNVSKDMQRIM